MNTAQRLAAKPQNDYTDACVIEDEARELAIKSDATNCYDRTWTFYDGSKLVKTRDGLKAE